MPLKTNLTSNESEKVYLKHTDQECQSQQNFLSFIKLKVKLPEMMENFLGRQQKCKLPNKGYIARKNYL